ncbi:BON domain-containing protein [Agrobacterium sp. a22-2]|uniref:BON domain-containing protein n=1 Tax=Agrobacterium sp. a22-2 TaxID=2283840 RepID=UPI0014459BA9|nr:BON domain-containing protein [Agrobacterium sp. a22-2]NKN35014.1 BON domain-containing protein [Agrobacterium sp. a22-2]
MVFKPQKFYGEEPVRDNAKIPPAEVALETSVAEQLAVSDGIDASSVSATAIKREIVLSGTVGSAQEVDRAVQVALDVPGVDKVSVNLAIGERSGI